MLNLYHMSTLLWRCYNQWISYSDLKVNLKLSLSLTLEVTTGPRDQCRSCARPKFGPIWYDVVEQFSFPSLVTDPGKKGVIGKLIHSSSCADFIQVQNAVSPNENPRYKTYVVKSCPYLAKFPMRVVTNLHFRS